MSERERNRGRIRERQRGKNECTEGFLGQEIKWKGHEEIREVTRKLREKL